MLRELQSVLKTNVEGDVAKLDCYIGTSSLFLQRFLLADGSKEVFHVHDSFEGLPHKLA
ncbi:hypothetical protein KBC77_04000 [Candidatus Saccharibacteria bacterium]|nr:hypothetical protein [Candidatus Saccharibacteria bacterium]